MNVTRFVREHDRWLREAAPTPENLVHHRRVVAFVHQERLVHLAVTLAFGLYAMIALGLLMFQPMGPTFLLLILLMGLLVPYIRHYFLLENHVQDWTARLHRWEGAPTGSSENGISPRADAGPVPEPRGRPGSL
jgi:hypothetical protein